MGWSARVSFDCASPIFCHNSQDAAAWHPLPLELDDFGAEESEAHGVNDAGQIAGFGWDQEAECDRRAMFWASAVSPRVVLPVVPSQDQAQANSINNPDGLGRVSAVGVNATELLALLWVRESPTAAWTVTDLNGVIGQCSDDWVITSAVDINDSGWIAAWGFRNSQNHAVLLTPIGDCPPATCDGDFDGDGDVNVIDLLTLLGAWGPCPLNLTQPCRTDFDCDGVSGVVELLEVLGGWGPCGNPSPEGPPESVDDCLDRFGLEDPIVLEKCICTVDPAQCS